MANLREFVLAQSSLVTGNTVRDHIKNPGAGGGSILVDSLDVDVWEDDMDVEIESSVIDVEIESDIEVEIEQEVIEVEVLNE